MNSFCPPYVPARVSGPATRCGRPSAGGRQRRLLRGGFTLLEVLLSLALTSLILVALGMAIHFHLHVLDVGRTHVEEAQLARVLLRRIADDLRGAVFPVTQNVDQNLAAAASGSTGSSGTTEGAGTSPTGPETTDTAADQTSASLTSLPHAQPGIYGDRYSIQVDVSRPLPPYQLQALCSLGGGSFQTGAISDVKTIAYYVVGPQSGTGANEASFTGTEQGLVRQEMNRAVALYAAEQGGLDPAASQIQLLAPEVVAIEFQYFDGSELTDYWDSTERGGLPLAVQVTLYIEPKNSGPRTASLWSNFGSPSAFEPQGTLAYSLLVYLPAARPSQTSDTSETSEASSSEGSSTSGTGTSSGGGSTQAPGGATNPPPSTGSSSPPVSGGKRG